MPDHENGGTGFELPPNNVYGFLLLEQYPLLPVAGMIDILRDADYVTDRTNFRLFTIGAHSREVTAMNGFRALTDYTIDDAPRCDTVVVCAGLAGHRIEDPRVFAWLRRRLSENTIIGSIATGAWVLAKAGLLSGRQCTVHWEDIPAFEESYPLIDVQRSLFVRDGPIFTCSGGTAAIDLFLQIVGESLGPDVSSDVARQILHQVSRAGSDQPPIKEGPHRSPGTSTFHRAAQLMHDHIDAPLPITEIAQRVGISQKQLERTFQENCQTTPQLHYRTIRLDQARTFIRLTNFEIWQIAVMTGFSRPQYLAKCYRDRFGVTPSAERRRLRQYAIPRDNVARGIA